MAIRTQTLSNFGAKRMAEVLIEAYASQRQWLFEELPPICGHGTEWSHEFEIKIGFDVTEKLGAAKITTTYPYGVICNKCGFAIGVAG